MPKRKSPFTASKKRKQRRISKNFDKIQQQLLKDSDKGSWFDQESQQNASRKKIRVRSSKVGAKKRGAQAGLLIVDIKCLQDGLSQAVCCKHCHGEDVEIIEDVNARQGLGTTMKIKCSNGCNESSFLSSKKKGRTFEINRLLTLGMRMIGRGHSSAERLLSILGLPLPVSNKPWAEYTRKIEEKARELCQKDMKEASLELKRELMDRGKRCKDSQLQSEIIDTGVSIDGSWCSRGWSATNGCVATISTHSGKVMDVVQMTNTCPECAKAEAKRAKGEISKMEYLGWVVEHEPKCFLNHEGSSSVSYIRNTSFII